MAYSSEQERADDQWQTYSGRAEIIINPRIYCQDINEVSDDCTRDSAARTKRGGKRNLVHDITHELGHILGLADYYCHYDHHPDGLEASTDPDKRSLMNSLNQPPYDECDPDDGAPTALDVRGYTASYTPAAVTELQAKTVQDTFRVWLSWNQADVFVESGFEVQRKTGSVWHEVASVVPNATSAVVKGQPVEGQQYRVVARTKALPHHETHGHTHSSAEAVVGLTVQTHPMLAPTNPHIVGTAVSSLTLAWTLPASAPSATPMFKVKYTTGSDCDASGTEFLPFMPSTSAAVAGATDATVSYPISNLKASTQYKLCVRSVREILPGFEYESDWASTTGTTAALPLPTSLTVRDVTDSKATLRWNKATDADGYEVQIDGADVETTLGKDATSYEFTLPSADTAYKLGVAAKHGDQMSAFATLTLLKPPSSITRSTTAHNSVKYTWTDGNSTGSATAAEVKIGAAGTKKTADSTTYHTFKDLTANEEYTFYFRLKNNQGPSAWRTETVTTPPLPRLTVSVSPRSASCYTGGSVSISWTISNGTAPYAVRVNGVNASGSRKTVTCQSTAGTQTVSVTATDASTPRRSGSASVSLTVTNRPPPPPTLSISASTSPTSCTTGGTVNVRWSVSGASGSYTVTVDGRSASTSPTSFTCQSTAGRQSITVEVRYSSSSSASDTVYVTVTAPPSLLDCLSTKAINVFASWIGRASHCGSATASALWTAFRTEGIQIGCIQRVGSKGGTWPKYQSGWPDFSIAFGAVLRLTGAACNAGSGVSGSSDAGALNCAEAVKPETGPAAVSVGGAACVIVRGGGAVQVSDGERTLNLTLSNGRDWVLFAASEFTGSSAGAFWVYDLISGGWVAFYPPDGSELERHAPADATGLPALLDAIAASAAPSVYPAPDR